MMYNYMMSQIHDLCPPKVEEWEPYSLFYVISMFGPGSSAAAGRRWQRTQFIDMKAYTVHFFLLTRYQSKISGIGVTPPTSSTVQWHTSITAPPLFEVYNGVECWLHHYLLFFVWPCSLARSCRRCCCRSAAREGELQGRWPSRHAALQGLRPALCCVPRNERLAGYLMWSYL